MPWDFPNGPAPGTIYEPNGAGTEPKYTWTGFAWDYGAVDGLLLSSLVPNAAICGSPAATVRALGFNFTNTCELLFDGAAQATTFVSVSELTVQVNPVPETVPRTMVVTVRDGATIGVGAVPFSFRIVTNYEWNIGIDETSPGTIDVRVANFNNEIGGVTVVPRAIDQGLALDLITGALTAPLATPILAGSIIEPPANSRGYVRQTTGTISTWVPPAATPLPDAGIGLTADMTTPPGVVNLDIANTNGEIGGVMTEARTNIQGLDMAATGLITVPLGTDLLAGSIVEPLPDGLTYVRQRSTLGVSAWVPEATIDFGIGLSLDTTTNPDIVHLTAAGDSPATLGGVYVIDRVRNTTEGLELGIDGRLRAPLATDSLAGTLLEPPPDDKGYVRRRTPAGVSSWVPPADPAPPPLAIELIIPNTAPVGSVPLMVEVHGTKFTATTVAIVDGAAKPTTYVSPTELMFQLDPSLETVRIATVTVQDTVGPVNGAGTALFHFVPATSLYRGLYSPVNNTPDIWATRQLGYMWIVDLVDPMVPEFSGVPGLAGLALNEGDHLVYDGTQYGVVDGNQTMSLYQGWWKPATNVPDIGTMVKYTGFMWIADTAIPNTPETPPLGLPGLDGVAIYEGDMILWDGANFVLMQGVLTPNYRGLWNVASNTPPIDQPAVGNNKPNWMWIAKTVNPNIPEIAPATLPGIGGLTINEGDHIVWDKPNAVFIRVSGGPLTDYGVGLSVSPGADPGDPQIVNLTPAGHAPNLLGGVYTLGQRTNTEGLDLDPAAGRLTVPLATDLLAGSIVEPPPDNAVYGRKRDTAGVSSWAPSAAGVFIGDDPPPSPTVGMLWFESDTGDMHVWYEDADSAQWVQF